MDINFTWPNQNGEAVDLGSIKEPFVLYFYPKDDTPGCTKEACGIRDAWSDYAAAGIKVFGASKDDAKSHQKFIAKYDLPFDLLTASEEDMAKLGVWKEKSMYGRTYMGISRETFLVKNGKVAKHYPKVKPADHAAEILADFAAL